MKYFFDTEFIEGVQKGFLGFLTKPTIELISIGIVAEDGREYYALSKDFNLNEAWNRDFIRQYVLSPIYQQHVFGDNRNRIPFTKKTMKTIIKNHGKYSFEIAREIVEFVIQEKYVDARLIKFNDDDFITINSDIYGNGIIVHLKDYKPKFYAYYADYDWVAFCWLFGLMIDLPKGFPMYCRDLKQMLDETVDELGNNHFLEFFDKPEHEVTFEDKLKVVTEANPNFPTQKNEHVAIFDARWNKELFDFIQTLK